MSEIPKPTIFFIPEYDTPAPGWLISKWLVHMSYHLLGMMGIISGFIHGGI